MVVFSIAIRPPAAHIELEAASTSSAARVIAAAPGDRSCIPEAARAAGATRRTLERLFVAETAMTLGTWRRRARLIESLRLLARGDAVTQVALEVGYESPSAFVAAFRNELGTTPGRYFDRDLMGQGIEPPQA